MKILLVCQYYYPERFSVADIAETLVKLGNEVTVLTAKPNYGFGRIVEGYEKLNYEERNGVKIHRVNVKPRVNKRFSIISNYLSFHKNAKRFVRHFKEEFDVVLSISLSPVISISPALLYAKKHNVPCLLFCEDLWPESPVITGAVKKNSLVYKFLYKWSKSIYKRVDRIVISSPSFEEYFRNVLKIDDKGFKCIYQPIMNSKGCETNITYENAHNIVYAGNIGTVQLVDNLVEAMKHVKTNDVKLHLLGTGSSLDKIKEKIVNDNLQDKVIYEGAFPLEKAEEYFKNADALVVSLTSDGYVGKTIPNKAIQFLKYSRPILGVISGDAKDLLSKANGTVFSSENPEDIAKSIDDICEMNKKDQDNLGLSNLNYFNSNLTTDVLVSQLYEELKAIKK